VVTTSSNSLIDGSQFSNQLPRIAMQRLWTAGQVNVAWGLKFWLPFDERITLQNQSISQKW
jgi:hypothetical protein